ncbi:MAG: glycosyltransferase [Chitinispirillaceae bacterium]|nr:glycosyltransferase [Chitinispirillaceae bacterium]
MLMLYSLLAVILLMYGAFLCFLAFMLLFHRAKSHLRDEKMRGPLPDVSVVVTFKDEAHNLARLIGSLERQAYKGNFEIILVNDCSTDNYISSISSSQRQKTVKTVHSVFSENRGLTSKQQALDTGIKAASHGWIACTDADMVLEPHWLDSLMRHSGEGTSLVFGHTVIERNEKPSLFTWFQGFLLETLFAAAYAFHRAGLIGSCMGNNLLFSRKAYLDAGGFDSVGYSIVEDMDLMLMFRRKKQRTTSTEPFAPTARTFPAATLRDYLQQLMRWSRGGFWKNPVLMFANVLLSAQNILLVVSIFPTLPGFIRALSVANFLLTWLFVAAAFRRIHSRERALLFLPFYPLHLVESAALFLFSAFNKKIFWKNRHIA